MRRSDADVTAWAKLETPGLLRRAFLLCADWQQAEDVVQETLIRLYVNWHRVDRNDNPVGYAQTTLFRVFISGKRRKSAGERPTADVPERPSPDQAPDLGMDLATALRVLSPAERCVIIARYLDDLSVAEVAHLSPSVEPDELTSADVLAVVKAHLPEDISAAEVGYVGNPEADELWKRQAGVLMTLRDAAGPARAEAALNKGLDPRSGCTREGHCRRIRAGGKTFYEFTDWKTRGGVRLYDVGTYYERPDGLVTSFQQHNFVDYDGPATRPTRPLTEGEGWPVTRPTMPLAEAEVQALLTAPEWDALAPRCRPELSTWC